MMTAALAGVPSATLPIGFESVTLKVSLPSCKPSFVMRMSKDFCVSPAAKRSVPRGVVDVRDRLRRGEAAEAQGDEGRHLVAVEQERGRAHGGRIVGRRLLRAAEVGDDELRAGEDLVDRAVRERDDVDGAVGRGLDV